MIVENFFNNKDTNIPIDFYETLPLVCQEHNCGYPMIMSDALTELQCSNPYCSGKVSYRLISLLRTVGISDITEQQVKQYVIDNNVTNAFKIFAYNYDTDGLLVKGMTDLECRSLETQLKEVNEFSLSEYIKLAYLPFLQDSIDIIFSQITDINEFYINMEKDGISYLERFYDTVTPNVTIRLLKVFETFMLYKDMLLEGLHFVNII